MSMKLFTQNNLKQKNTMATDFKVRCPECGETYYIIQGKSFKDSGLLDYGGTYLCRICKHKFWNGGKVVRPSYDNLEDYGGSIATRRYWDPFEEKSITGTVEERLANLSAFVKLGGNIGKEINCYASDRSSIYTDSIMTAIETYLNYLIAGEKYGLPAAFTERIQCLTKTELVHLLEEELKTRIIEDKESCYVIRKDNLLDDNILLEIERSHAASHPDENPETIARRKRFWSAGSHGYWYHKNNY